jgi:hypothetical protein
MSALGDAVQAGMIASMDPMNLVVRQVFQAQAAAGDLELDKGRTAFVKELRKELKEAKAAVPPEDDEVLEGLRRLIRKHSAG